MPLQTAKLQELARRYTAAWCSKDPAQVASFFSPHGSLSVNGAAPAVGGTAIAQLAREYMLAFPDLQLLMDRLIIRGDRAVYHWTFLGTNTGPGGSGHRVRFSGFEIWQVGSDGFISKSEGQYDAAEYRRQLQHGCR
jgi:predicted ester cyclase